MPSPAAAHGLFAKFDWNEEQATRYIADDTLPCDLTTIEAGTTALLLWIFDARETGGKLPEVELERVPDFDRFPAMCAFDMARSQ